MQSGQDVIAAMIEKTKDDSKSSSWRFELEEGKKSEVKWKKELRYLYANGTVPDSFVTK